MPSIPQPSNSDKTPSSEKPSSEDSSKPYERTYGPFTAEQKNRLLSHFADIQKHQRELGLESYGPKNR